MINELKDWSVSPLVVVADAGYGDNGLFRTALTTRGLEYVVQVKGLTVCTLVAWSLMPAAIRGSAGRRNLATGPHLSRPKNWHNHYRSHRITL